MPRLNVHITEQQHKELKYIYAENGTSISDSVRIAIDLLLDKYKNADKNLGVKKVKDK